MAAARSTIVYDANCGPCMTFKRAIDFLDYKHRLIFVPLKDAEDRGLLAVIAPPVRWRSFHLLKADGSAESGAKAIPELARALPSGSLTSIILRAPGVSRGIEWVYWKLSALHGACYRSAQL